MNFKYGLMHIILKKLEKNVLEFVNKRNAKQFEHKKVEFYLMDSFEIFHYLPIYNSLIQEGIEANFVCEPIETNTVHKWFDYDNAIKILDNLGIKYTQSADPYAKISFTTQQASILSKYYGIKINLNYGCGFNKTNFGNTPESMRGFDYKFVHSKYMAKIARKVLRKNQVKIIGYPKHDNYFKNLPNKKNIIDKLNIKTNKPILVYFPTWDDDSSIQNFGDEINKLRKKFYVVTKAHHCTFRVYDKKNDLEKLYQISDKVLEGNSNFSDAVVIADIALIDGKSGSSCEVPYLKSSLPIVYLSVRKDLQNYFKKDIFKFGRFINSPEKLTDTVLSTFKNDEYIKFRTKNMEYYLGKNDSNSTKRAIDEIKRILNKK